jgi:hypothetical protein
MPVTKLSRSEVRIGPATVVLTLPGQTEGATEEVDIACLLRTLTITPTYTDTGEAADYWCGESDAAATKRSDQLDLELAQDWDQHMGLVHRLYAHDTTSVPIVITPISDPTGGSTWTGSVQLRLGALLGAAKSRLVMTVTWPVDGVLEFTPAAAAPAGP